MPGILSLLFGKRKKRRRPAHTRVYGDFSRGRPKGLTKALVRRARKYGVRVTTGKRKKYKSVRLVKSQIKKKIMMRRRRKRKAAAAKRRRARFGRKKRRRRSRRTGFGVSGGNYMPLSMVMSPYPRAVMAGPPYI